MTWNDVLRAVARGEQLYYQGPLDRRPWLVTCKVSRRFKVRVFPGNKECSAFTADGSHVDRFMRRAQDARGV